MIRCLTFIRYPDGISIEEGDRWYLGTRTQEEKHLEGLCRYLTWKADESSWRRQGREWHRLTEMGFHDLRAFSKTVKHGRIWTPAPYGAEGYHAESILIGDKPEYDFLNDPPDFKALSR
jgi:hypothetical protein